MTRRTQQRPSLPSIPLAVPVAVATALLLAACGSSSSSSDEAHDHQADTIDSAGRLAVFDAVSPAVRIHDLDQALAVEATHATDHLGSAIYASPKQRYAVLYQASGNQIQFIDGGLWQEDHGDHLHDYRQASRPMSWRLAGPRPSHYNLQAGKQAAIFMDGEASASRNAAIHLIDEAGIERGQALASTELTLPIHGLAVPLDDQLVTVGRAADAADASPTQLERYRRNGASFVRESQLPVRCDRLHGAFDNGNALAVGCADGVLLARHATTGGVDDGVKVPTPIRVSTIAGHPRLADQFIGFGNDGIAPAPVTTRFFTVDATAATATELVPEGWETGRLRRAHGFDRSGQRFHLLDDLGTLYVFERRATGWAQAARTAQAVPAMPSAAPFPAFSANSARDEVYLTDPQARQVVTVDAASGAVKSRQDLGYVPGGLTWLGIAR